MAILLSWPVPFASYGPCWMVCWEDSQPYRREPFISKISLISSTYNPLFIQRQMHVPFRILYNMDLFLRTLVLNTTTLIALPNRHLNFTLAAGEKLALVGENGAGKTTLVKLLARLYDPSEGRILLDGYDLREYDLAELRKNVGVIFQDYIRYQMTAAQNIAVGNIAEVENRELVERSAQKSMADAMIQRLAGKYDQALGRRFNQGVELSGGEWQKIALARAYMKDAQLLILDEPTSALDARAEYEVFQRFADLTEGKTAILISHRFSTVRMADRILVLDKGELLEIGSHEELLAKEGRYAELFKLQAMGYQ